MNFYLLGMTLSDIEEKEVRAILKELHDWRDNFGQALADATGKMASIILMPSQKECGDISFFIDKGDDVGFAVKIVKKILKLHPCKYISIKPDVQSADHPKLDVTQISLGIVAVEKFRLKVVAAIDRQDAADMAKTYNPKE